MAAPSTAAPHGPATGNPRLPLLALGAAAFGIGTTEFVIMGLLPQVASDLGVSIPTAGLLVTGYALSVTFGSPFLAVATAHMDRRRALLALMGVFIVGNLMCALAPSYWLLMGARVLTALCHGAFFGLGAVVAASIVLPGRKAQAIAMMFAGLTLANVLGVPAGTALGEAFGWRSTFFVVVGIGIAAAAALAAFLPRNLPLPAMSFAQEARSLASVQVVLAMLISIASSASLFSVFTYIAPILQQVTGLSVHGTTLMLLLFGVGLTLGNLLGGRLADIRLMPTVIGTLAIVVPLLCLLVPAARHPVAAAFVLLAWGVAAFTLIAPLQLRVVNAAAQAPNLASTINQGAFNLGNAIGAWAGGLALVAGVPYDALPYMGAAIAALALALACLSYALDLKGRRAEPALGRG